MTACLIEFDPPITVTKDGEFKISYTFNYGEPKMNIWDTVSRDSCVDRDVCKMVVISILFGGDIISLMRKHKLTTGHVVSIRTAFDDAVLEEAESSSG